MTVAELIALLKQLPHASFVWVEGCDCTGAAVGVSLDKSDGSVLVRREDGERLHQLPIIRPGDLTTL